MTQQRQVYRCYVCGNVVEVLLAGGGELTCCGQPMLLLTEKTDEAGFEQHRPVIRTRPSETGVEVTVGSVPHPMQSNHFIEWIEVVAAETTCRRTLRPGEQLQARFDLVAPQIYARACCNRHGLWRS